MQNSDDRIAPIFPVSNVDEATEYFCEKLGFVQTTESGFGWAVLSRGGSRIILVPENVPPGCAIQVNDVDSICEDLVATNAEFESGPMNQEYGQRDFAVRGPDGYEIIFWAPIKVDESCKSPPDETGDDSIPF